QFFTQQSVCPSKPRAASFARRMLWETVSKALLKSRWTTSTTFPSSISLQPPDHPPVLPCSQIGDPAGHLLWSFHSPAVSGSYLPHIPGISET
ncbi:unnamed protein product, partial [Bubo scandiacus]